jgi:hypothetical protein
VPDPAPLDRISVLAVAFPVCLPAINPSHSFSEVIPLKSVEVILASNVVTPGGSFVKVVTVPIVMQASAKLSAHQYLPSQFRIPR